MLRLRAAGPASCGPLLAQLLYATISHAGTAAPPQATTALAAWAPPFAPPKNSRLLPSSRSSKCLVPAARAPGTSLHSSSRRAAAPSLPHAVRASSDLPNLKGPLRGVLFDMDGTLSDSESIHWKSYQSVFATRVPDFPANPISREYYMKHFGGRTKVSVMDEFFPELSSEDKASFCKAMEMEYERLADSGELKALPGLGRVLDFLDASGVPSAIVTNAPPSEMEYSLTKLAVKERFVHLVPSAECSAGKPDPAPYLEGLKRLGLEPGNAIALEDSPAGIQSAVGAGLVTIGVMTSRGEEELKSLGASLCVADYEDAALWECLRMWTGTTSGATPPRGTAGKASPGSAVSNYAKNKKPWDL